MIQKLPSGRWRARLKSGRVFVVGRTFDTKREAADWLVRERAAMAGGVDPRAGRQRVRNLLRDWLEVREYTVSRNTYVADASLRRLVPTSVQALQVSAVSEREIARTFETLIRQGLSEASVVRYPASLSTFFGWCVREKLIARNPVVGTRVPRSSEEPVEMKPFSEDDLEMLSAQWASADLLLVLAWTGLRWAEARALRVEDFVEVPTPGLIVRRSQPEGNTIKSTKGRHSRRVPVANRVLPLIRALAQGKAAGDLLLTTRTGAQLHRSAVLRTVNWRTTGHGRRVHDLRHTAACLWLARGVDPGTVQAWMGHESIATTNRYLHFLGTGADRAGLDRLNEPRHGAREDRGYTGGYTTGRRRWTTLMRSGSRRGVCAGQPV